MSDTRNEMTDFIGIPRADYGYATLKSADESHPNESKSSDLIEQDTVTDDKDSKNEEPVEQEIATNAEVLKNESEIEQGNSTNGKLPKNELESPIEQKKTTTEIRKNELEISVEEEINIDSESIVLDAASERMNENQRSNRESVNTSMKSEIKTSSVLLDCNDGSLTKEDGKVPQDTQIPDHTDEQNSISEGSLKTSEIGSNETSCSLQNGNAKSSVEEDGKVSLSAQVPDDEVGDRSSSYEGDSKKSTEETNDASWTEYSDEDSSDEEVSVIQDLPSDAKDPEDRVDEQNSSSDSNSRKSSEETGEENAENADACQDEIFVDQDLSDNTQDSDGKVEVQNSGFESDLKQSAVVMVEEKAKEPVDTSENKISDNSNLPVPRRHRTSEQVTEMISTFFNSPEYLKKMKEIDDIVKQLTAVEFVSSDLSPEDLVALEELYGRKQAKFDGDSDSDSETDADLVESNAMKRKSKLSELDEDAEELRVASKKYKFSKDLDGKTQSGENPCCLEEQFRLAYEEANEGQLQKGKEYNFPLTTGSGEYLKKRYKLCKHQLDKIDAMVVNAMSLENYLAQFVDEPDNCEDGMDRKGKKVYKCKLGNEDLAAVFGSNEAKVSKPGRSITRMRRYSEKYVQCEDSRRFSGELQGKTKSFGFFGLGEIFNYVKNFVLCVSFAGALIIAVTVAKAFGVTFPAPKSQSNNLRSDSR